MKLHANARIFVQLACRPCQKKWAWRAFGEEGWNGERLLRLPRLLFSDDGKMRGPRKSRLPQFPQTFRLRRYLGRDWDHPTHPAWVMLVQNIVATALWGHMTLSYTETSRARHVHRPCCSRTSASVSDPQYRSVVTTIIGRKIRPFTELSEFSYLSAGTKRPRGCTKCNRLGRPVRPRFYRLTY